MYLEVHGLEVHAVDRWSAEQFDDTVNAYPRAERSASDHTEKLRLQDPNWAFAHVLHG
jgi:hypothetical protein